MRGGSDGASRELHVVEMKDVGHSSELSSMAWEHGWRDVVTVSFLGGVG